jgi:hypothetical protein
MKTSFIVGIYGNYCQCNTNKPKIYQCSSVIEVQDRLKNI